MCVAQQLQLTPNSTLRQPTLLILLPYPHVKRAPPRTLSHDSEYRTGHRQELEDLASVWTDDSLRVVYQALDVEISGVAFLSNGSRKGGVGVGQARSRQFGVDNSMYI